MNNIIATGKVTLFTNNFVHIRWNSISSIPRQFSREEIHSYNRFIRHGDTVSIMSNKKLEVHAEEIEPIEKNALVITPKPSLFNKIKSMLTMVTTYCIVRISTLFKG